MAEGITVANLEDMCDELQVYDVEQRAWEHITRPALEDINHVLLELDRADRKNFTDGEVTRTDLAPDAMQHAFRIARRADLELELLLPSEEAERLAWEKTYENDPSELRLRLGAYAVARFTLAGWLHDTDHRSTKREALARSDDLAIPVQALVLFATNSARDFSFDLGEEFSRRLSSLRERFGISDPEEAPQPEA